MTLNKVATSFLALPKNKKENIVKTRNTYQPYYILKWYILLICKAFKLIFCKRAREIFESIAIECDAVDITFPETRDTVKNEVVMMCNGYSFVLRSMLPVCGQHSSMCNNH